MSQKDSRHRKPRNDQLQGQSSKVALSPSIGQIRVLSRNCKEQATTPTVAENATTKDTTKKNKKRKPTLTTMSIGNMLPAGVLTPGKGKNPIHSQVSRPATSSIPSKQMGSCEAPFLATASTSSSLLSPERRSREEMGPFIDLTEFPSLPEGRKKVDHQRQHHSSEQRIANLTKPRPKRTEPRLETSTKRLSATAPVFRLVEDRSATSLLEERSTSKASTIERDVSGDEHALLRLMQRGKFVVQNKGRQRIRPRKKKFSALKKKVLQERLLKWRELHEPSTNANSNPPPSVSGDTNVLSCTVCVHGFVDQDELDDDDEYNEIVCNLRDMASKVGHVRWVFVPRSSPVDSIEGKGPASFVEFEHEKDACAASDCWNGLLLGGQILETRMRERSNVVNSEEEWRSWCLLSAEGSDHHHASRGVFSEIVLEGALTDDDLEDDDCLEESLNDIRVLASNFGKVTAIRVEKAPKAQVHIEYEEPASIVQKAALELGHLTIGGNRLSAYVAEPNYKPGDDACDAAYVILSNVITEDDLEDQDCLKESLGDIQELAERYGEVTNVCLEAVGETAIRVTYGNFESAASAASAFNDLTIGGLSVKASAFGGKTIDANDFPTGSFSTTPTLTETDTKETGPMFSKDKRIPEQFATCLRVPKIPNSGQPRKYATLLSNDNVKPLLMEMLGELMRLQKRAVEDKNAKARRRLVLGLREVARGIRAHKVKLVVMANNLDEYGAIDQKLQEILDLAHAEAVPVFFELSKRALGKAVGKSIKVSVVGVQNADGAYQSFKKLIALAPT